MVLIRDNRRPSAADLTAVDAGIDLARHQAGMPAHAILIVARSRTVRPDFQHGRAGEAVFTIRLTRPCDDCRIRRREYTARVYPSPTSRRLATKRCPPATNPVLSVDEGAPATSHGAVHCHAHQFRRRVLAPAIGVGRDRRVGRDGDAQNFPQWRRGAATGKLSQPRKERPDTSQNDHAQETRERQRSSGTTPRVFPRN